VIEDLTRVEYEALLRQDFTTFVAYCFHDLNPQAELAMNWRIEVIATKLTAVRQGKIRRLIINLPPRHLKSLMASVAFPAWCLGHDRSAQILCVSYAQDLADKPDFLSLAPPRGIVRMCRCVPGTVGTPTPTNVRAPSTLPHHPSVPQPSMVDYRRPDQAGSPGQLFNGIQD